MYIVGHHDDIVLYLRMGIPVHPAYLHGRYEERIRPETDAIIASFKPSAGYSWNLVPRLQDPPQPSNPPGLHGPVHGSGSGLCKSVANNIISDARYLPVTLQTELVVGICFRFGGLWTLTLELVL
jgi:hypothetical protein